ncbi:MAG: GNAT family N-acetyltransferase [Candidatus Thermoplasmatota archaeon]|nr:GNAT family N-acetyltransferase [Candidatus Thermoplasmatota archaeon]
MCRTAIQKDRMFIDKLQKENSYAVGFIQSTIWDNYVFGGERNFFVLICEKNDDPVGYTLVTPGRTAGDFVKIQQIAVRQDARRLHYGSMLIGVIRKYCQLRQRMGARLRCRQDLESNNFWRALGFRQYGTWKKGAINHVGFRASDDINLWEIKLNESIMTFDFMWGEQ